MEEIITIDAAGRVVVPKAMRMRLHLREGTKLRVRDEGASRLILEPISTEGVPVEVDGLLVIRGKLVGEVPDHREQRAERIRSLTRLPR
jgi:AbrB family looped-hinge helix DNA binding protein